MWHQIWPPVEIACHVPPIAQMMILAKVLDHSIPGASWTTNSVMTLALPCQNAGQPTVRGRLAAYCARMTGSKGSQTFSTLKRGPAVVWNFIGNWGGMLQISHRNVGSAGYLLGTLWDVVALVAPGLVGRANLFRTLVIVIWAIGRCWLVILICGVA